ncbi:MAG: hypothetical protein JWN52_2783 [Actinomycetia bacterium]|nr:hypothetical protein [Actinomycetes bacterium]
MARCRSTFRWRAQWFGILQYVRDLLVPGGCVEREVEGIVTIGRALFTDR